LGRPARLVRQALTESLVLALLGGVAGLALAVGHGRPGRVAATQLLPVADVSMDWRVLAGILVLTTATGPFGIAPRWSQRRVPAEVLKEGGRSGTSRRIRRWGDAPVVARWHWR
jgi:predicted lysophospholipase L1 biosynthesis ABC-type transport system permease subunit